MTGVGGGVGGGARQSASEAIRNSITLPNVGLQLSRNNYSSFYSKHAATANQHQQHAPTPHHPNYPPMSPAQPVGASQSEQKPQQQHTKSFPFEALARQGVNIQEVYVPRDLQIPTNSNGNPPIGLRAGQKVMLIQTPKGIYLRLNEQIIKIKLPQSLLSQFMAARPGNNPGNPGNGDPTGRDGNQQVETIFSGLAQKSAPNSANDNVQSQRDGL